MKMEKQPGLLVYLAGLGTSALTLFAVRALVGSGVNVMGWYVNGILPVGAILVGMLSGIGFALASRYLNVRLTRSYVIGMLSTGLLDYAAAQYLNWQDLLEAHHVAPERYPLWQYLRDLCENMTFNRAGSSDKGSALGSFGYLFKTLEMAGFAVGTMLPAAILYNMPYCRACQRYLLQHRSGILNARARRDEVLSRDKHTRAAAIQDAVNDVNSQAAALLGALKDGSLAQTEAAVDSTAKALDDAAAHIAITVKKCPTCDCHHITITLHHTTVDKRKAAANILTIDKPQPATSAAAA